MRVVFVLPGGGGGGGSYSVVQEVLGLAQIGVDAAIAIHTPDRFTFLAHHPELEGRGLLTPTFTDVASLARAVGDADLAVATTAASAVMLSQALADQTRTRFAHYIQDYEPLFFAPGSLDWRTAVDSFAVEAAGLRFAKSAWLREIIAVNHPLEVAHVSPSIDHEVFHPDLSSRTADAPLTICAMVRPKTARRGPHRTARILARLSQLEGRPLRLVAFGADEPALRAAGVSLPRGVANLGPLQRRQMAALLRASDFFLDLSDYQAFGRTAAEGMACGCVPIAPVFGGAGEFIAHGRSGLLVDTRSDEAIMDGVATLIGAPQESLRRMRREARTTALEMTIEKAAYSMASLFEDHLAP